MSQTDSGSLAKPLRVDVNLSSLLKNFGEVFSGETIRIRELLQNARRAGAARIHPHGHPPGISMSRERSLMTEEQNRKWRLHEAIRNAKGKQTKHRFLAIAVTGHAVEILSCAAGGAYLELHGYSTGSVSLDEEAIMVRRETGRE